MCLSVFSLQSSCIRVFRGYNGEDMFRLKKKEMDRLIGQQEAQRLESQILVQKNKEGVISNQAEMMIDACTFEIYNYLRCRRKKLSNKTIQKFRNEIPGDKFQTICFQYKTARSGGKELQAILHKRKEMADRKDDSVEVADYSDSESKWLMKYNPM